MVPALDVKNRNVNRETLACCAGTTHASRGETSRAAIPGAELIHRQSGLNRERRMRYYG